MAKVKKDGDSYVIIDETGEEIGGIPCDEIRRADYEAMHQEFGEKEEEITAGDAVVDVDVKDGEPPAENEGEKDTSGSAPPRKKPAEKSEEKTAKKKSLWWGDRL